MCSKWRPCWILLAVGAALAVITALSIPLLHYVVKREVQQRVSLQPGSDTYAMWLEPSVPIYMEIYLFDLKNPVEVLEGAKPYVEQKGPYVYREYRKKVNIVHNNNDTITYKENKLYVFDQAKSVGPDSDTFTTINMPLITFCEFIYWHRGLSPLVSILMNILSEDVFITRSVRDIVWGYKDQMLALGRRFIPSLFYTDIAGVLAGKNNTDDGVYTIYSGVEDLDLLGDIFLYNGSRSLNFWTSPTANMVNGSDGTLCHPLISKELKAYMFSTDICRSVHGVYNGTISTPHGVSAWRFRAPPEVMDSAAKNPENAGFCTPAGNCMGSGVLNISTCQTLCDFHLPIVASFPHFHLADPQYQDAILGLDPQQDDLTVDMDIEPVSGIIMHVAKRLQINMHIRGDTGIKQLKSMRSMVYPILWVNETGSIDAAHAHKLTKELLIPLGVAHIVQYVLFAAGALFVLFAFIGCIVKYTLQKREVGKQSAEESADDESADDRLVTEDTDRLIPDEQGDRLPDTNNEC